MTVDRVVAFVALITMYAFIVTLGVFVREVDLFVVIALGIGLAGYDMWRQVLGPSRD